MKKTIALMLALLAIFNMVCLGESRSVPGDETFFAAKQAFTLMSEMQFSDALAVTGLDAYMTGEELGKLIQKQFKMLTSMEPQTEYAVAWKSEDSWYLAVPGEEPGDKDVMSAVFTVNDGLMFTEITFAPWEKVVAAYKLSDTVIWNTEYAPEYIVLID